tara:strand:- start:1068 stop:1481 length:414 start_codon:yes stop_codon:yes gene_type:complete
MKYKLEPGNPRTKEAEHIIFIVSKSIGMDIQTIKSTSRSRDIVDARRICYVLLKSKMNLTWGEIGSHFDRDHASIIHNYNAHEHLYKNYFDYRIKFDKAEGRLKNNEYIENDLYEVITNMAIRLDYIEKLIKEYDKV